VASSGSARSERRRYRGRTGLTGLLVLTLLIAAASFAGEGGGAVKIYVAASTKDAVDDIVRAFTAATGLEVEVSPGSSTKLAKQILEGAPADLFLSADQANAGELEKKGLVSKRRNLLGNRLVVVVPSGSATSVRALGDLANPEVRQLALALDPVPAGAYAREALRKAGVWERVESKVIGGEDVRATLAFVEQGADAGIVYVTDAMASSKVRVAFEIDSGLHRPIEYPLVLTTNGAKREGALRLYEHLSSEEAAEVFRKARFQVLR
jgi:molybdate transport system substrate-binding protein